MNSTDVIVSVSCMSDIEKITSNTKYINLAIDKVDIKVIDYFLLNGSDYLYSDSINNKNGFIYVSYDVFKNGESIIDNIIDNMPNKLSNIELIRYVYISLGKIFSVDINMLDDKNDVISFNNISTINNIWGSLSKGKVTDVSACKIFMYVLSRLGIDSELISSSIKGNIANKINLDNDTLIVDLYNDISYIQGGFVTKYFDKYNEDKKLDKKILYIKDDYTDYYIDNALKGIDYTKENMVSKILSLSEKFIDIKNIGIMELSKIYKDIFNRYSSNYDVKINNFYVYNGDREHFIVISYSDKYYSFNYNKGCFIDISYDIILDNLKNKRIGLYNNEDFDIIKKGVVL